MDYKEFLVPVEIAEALKKIGFDKDDDEVIKLYEYESRKIVEPTWEVHYRSSYFSYYLDHPKEFCPLFTKFKRRLLLLGLIVPGLNIIIVILYPLPIIFSIIKDTIKEELKNEKD